MRRIISLFTLLSINAIMNAQSDLCSTLSLRHQHLSVIACLEAKGDLQALEPALGQALDDHLTINEVKEALSQLYAYTGFPRCLNALGTLRKVLEARAAKGIADPEGADALPLPADYDALRQGTQVQSQLTGGPFDYSFAPAVDYYLKAHLFGDIFARTILTPADREVVTVSALAGMEGVEPQLAAHVRGAVNMGVTHDQLRSIPIVLASRVGAVEAWRAGKAVQDLLNEPAAGGRPVDFSIWPKGEPNTAYARYFTGRSYIASFADQADAPVNVTFEPACRNNWHIHHHCVQVLVCVAGRGWYQEWGKEAVEMTPGCVIAIPEGVKHWHGAARDSWFQHLTYMTHVEDQARTEWLEPVDEEVYGPLR
ncbi:MAG: carboxymuconolactone decarboxylase family protein [Paludibacteraceae bacterium]|nr:carboxymuconolactone decarboxylase family protein [Paludibacteraceae bacterium]